MSLMLPRRFSFFGAGRSKEEQSINVSSPRQDSLPSLKLVTDRDTYRSGDTVTATIEVCSQRDSGDGAPSLMVDNLSFEIEGVEKLDTQWFATPKPPPGSKQKRGENLFLDCSAPSIVSKVILSSGSTRTYTVRVELPKVLPPSYRGTAIRYIYYVRATLSGRWLVSENGRYNRLSKDGSIQLEARMPLQIWVCQTNNKLLNEGMLPMEDSQVAIYWKEKDVDCEWTKANEISDGLEEGYESSKDDVSSLSSYNPNRGRDDMHFRSSISLQSMATQFSNNDAQRSSFPLHVPVSQVSVAEISDEPAGDLAASLEKLNYSSPTRSPTLQRKIWESGYGDTGASSFAQPAEPTSSEGFVRGRSYNIRVDDQVLLRFSPRSSDSAYYFGDMIGGTLTLFHGGARKCLELAVSLETSEILSQRFVHPSRRSSPTVTKVQSDHHEVVADLVQTSFLFSIPVDGHMSFSTPYIAVQWALRFEFFTTPKYVDWTRYEHPLLVEEREKGDWVLPITVHAPPSRSQATNTKSENLSLGNSWVQN